MLSTAASLCRRIIEAGLTAFGSALVLAVLACASPTQPIAAQVTSSQNAANHFSAGLRHERASRLDSARIHYTAALLVDPSGPLARVAVERLREVSTGLAKAQPPPPDHFRAVRRLVSLGLDAQAAALLAETVKQHPGDSIPPDLQYLAGGKIDWWRSTRLYALRTGRPLLEIAGALVSLLLMVGILYAIAKRRRPGLAIVAFDSSNVDHNPGASFSALVEDELSRLSRGASTRLMGGQAINVVKGPIDPLELPKSVAAVVPVAIGWLNALPALVENVLPSRRITLTGTLHRSHGRGPGVTLVLTRGTTFIASLTLWRSQFLPRSRRSRSGDTDNIAFARLAEPVAIWLLYQITTDQHNRLFKVATEPLSILGAKSWRSYALFRAGVHFKDDGDAAAAREVYQEALERDQHNRAARVNLGSLYADEGKLDQGQRELKLAHESSEGDLHDPVLYSSLFRLASIRYDRGDYPQAAADAASLVKNIEDARKLLEQNRKYVFLGYLEAAANKTGIGRRTLRRLQERVRREYEHLIAYLDGIEPSSRTLMLGTATKVACSGAEVERLWNAFKTLDPPSASPVTQYNFACTCWIFTTTANAPDAIRAVARERALDHLERALELRPLLRVRAEQDPSIKGLFSDPIVAERAKSLLLRYSSQPLSGTAQSMSPSQPSWSTRIRRALSAIRAP